MRSFTLMCLVGALSLFVGTASGQFGGSSGAGYPTQEYSDLVIVLDEPSFLNLDTALVSATLNQIPLTELIGDDVDADSFRSFQAYFHYVESDMANRLGRPARLHFRYQTSLSDVGARAIWQQLLEKLIERLSRTVERLEEHSRRQQEDLKTELKARLAGAEHTLQVMTDVHIHLQVENISSVEAVREQRRKLHEQRRELEMQIAASEARREAIQEQIALTRDQAQVRAEDDQIAAHLKIAIRLAEKELVKLREAAQAGSLPESHVLRAQGEVASKTIDLLRHQKSQAETSAAKQIASLNEQLTAVTIDMAEGRRILELTLKRWAETEKELVEQLHLEGKLHTVEAEIAQQREQVQQLQAQLREVESAVRPRSTVRIVPWNE